MEPAKCNIQELKEAQKNWAITNAWGRLSVDLKEPVATAVVKGDIFLKYIEVNQTPTTKGDTSDPGVATAAVKGDIFLKYVKVNQIPTIKEDTSLFNPSE